MGLYQNEVLAELPFEGRLLFAGLPLIADRAGRLEDRPKRIKAALFPFDGSLAIDDLLTDLAERGFITRYQVEAMAVIQITNFQKHQKPHPKETQSVLPAIPKDFTESRLCREKVCASRALSSLSSVPSLPSLKNVSSEPPPAASEPPAVPPILVFSCVGAPQSWDLTQANLDEWVLAYPNLDITGECRKALVWLRANPGRRKTARGMANFLVKWFGRAVDRRSGAERRGNVGAEAAEWRCPHLPRCDARWSCKQRVDMDAFRAAEKAVG